MIGGMIKNSTMTPFYQEGWIYSGFSMQADWYEWQKKHKK
jgi:hypothetical protein